MQQNDAEGMKCSGNEIHVMCHCQIMAENEVSDYLNILNDQVIPSVDCSS